MAAASSSSSSNSKRVPRNYWRLTVISQYVPEVLRKLARQGRIRPTIRRVYYTIASDHPEFPRTKSGYTRLSALLTDVRLRSDDYKDWDSRIYDYRPNTFSDDSRSEVSPPRYVRPKRFAQEHVMGMIYVFDNYDPNIWEGQDHVVEIMIEKRTMEATVKDIVKADQVTVFSAGGNDGLSHLEEQYARWKEYQRQGKDAHLGYLGDLDAWGEHMDMHDIVKKILQMIEDDIAHDEEPLNWNWSKKDWDNDDEYNKEHGYHFESHYDPNKPEFTFERLCLTEDQVELYDLIKLDQVHISQIENPKIQQINFAARHGGYVFTVELDAIVILHEEEFKQLIHNFIYRWYDHDIWDKVEPLLSAEVKDQEIKKRITFKKLALDEYKKWSKDELELDDEAKLNEINAEVTTINNKEVEDLLPISDTLYDDPVAGHKKMLSQSRPNAIRKVKQEMREKEWQERNVKDLEEVRQEIAKLPDDKQKLNRLQADKQRYQDIISKIEPDPDYVDGRPRSVWKWMYHSLDYYEQRLADTESDLKRLREKGIVDE
jgi:hypothetical protein